MKKAQSGFTLVELLVVVAILGVLSALAISNYFFAKRNAANALAASTLRSLLPALDVASSKDVPATFSTAVGPDGGPVHASIPEARNSDGVFGYAQVVAANHYRAELYHFGSGTICYKFDSEGTPTTTSGPVSSCDGTF